MPTYIINLHEDATDEEVQAVKDEVKKNGGTIAHEYTLTKAFSVELPEVHAQSFASHPKVKQVEKDQEVKTQ